MAKTPKPRKPAPRAARAALSEPSPLQVEAGDLLISLNEDMNYLVQMKTDSIRRLSLMERNQVTEHYADARAAVEFRPIIVPMACRRVDEYPIAKSARRRSR